MQHGDQGSCQDAFLQPQVSHSSPIKTRDRGSHEHYPHIAAASADLADLVRDYNALSARCQASEQQLARTRRELCKERQRSRHLRASYDALTTNHMQLGRELQQQRASIAGSMLPAGHRNGLPALANGGQRGSYSSSNSSSQDHMLSPMCPRPMQPVECMAGAGSAATTAQQAGAAASRYHRYSTDTEVADQSRNGSSHVPVEQTQGSNIVGYQPLQAAAPPAAAAAVKFTVARLDRSLQSLGGAAGVNTSTCGPACVQPNGVNEEPNHGPPLSGIRTSPNKRAAQQQDNDAADATGSPKKYRQELAGMQTFTTSSKSSLQHPYGPFGETAGFADGTAAAVGTTKPQYEQRLQEQQQQQPRLLSKRPAHQFSPEPQPTEQPMVRAARRLRTGGRSCDSSASSCSSKQELPGSATCRQEPSGAPAAAEAARQCAATPAAAGATGAAAAVSDELETSEAAAAELKQPPKPQAAAAAASGNSSSSSSNEAGATGHDAPKAAHSSCGIRANLPPAPYGFAPGSEAGSSGASSHRRSRLSTVTDSNALALVPVTAPRSSYSSRCDTWHDSQASRAAASQGRPSFSATAGDAQRAFDIPEPIPEPSATTPGASAGNNNSSSYRSRAAKAAKGLAKKLKKLFITATSGSSSHAHGINGTRGGSNPAGAAGAGSSDGGRGGKASSRASSSRDGDFRRSWQGPFFSSGAAARAASAQDSARQSKDDSHADTERKHSKGKRWPKWARKYGGYSSSDSSSDDEQDNIFDQDPFGPTFSPLRHNFCKNNPQQSQQGPAGAGAGAGKSPFSDPFGPAFSPLRQSMGCQPSGQQQGPGGRGQRDAGDNDGFGPGWLGID